MRLTIEDVIKAKEEYGSKICESHKRVFDNSMMCVLGACIKVLYSWSNYSSRWPTASDGMLKLGITRVDAEHIIELNEGGEFDKAWKAVERIVSQCPSSNG